MLLLSSLAAGCASVEHSASQPAARRVADGQFWVFDNVNPGQVIFPEQPPTVHAGGGVVCPGGAWSGLSTGTGGGECKPILVENGRTTTYGCKDGANEVIVDCSKEGGNGECVAKGSASCGGFTFKP
jgi:hypothetical protein